VQLVLPVFGSPTTTETFEVWIQLNNSVSNAERIIFSYGNITLPANVTIGAEDATGTVGNAYYFNGTGTAVTSNTELVVSTEGFAAEVVTPLPAALPLFATGLRAIGLLAWRRRRKAAMAS
jgi:hypothetical protein